MLVAWLFFGAGPDVLLYSQVRGILLTLYVLYIIWMALVLYRVVDEAGAIEVIGQGIARLTAEPTMQLLLLAWAFSSFLQGVAGFGVPIAVVAPLLIGLGFAPVVAVAAVAIGHSWSVTFGDIASSFQALMAATALPGEALAPWASLFLGVACFGCGIAAAWAYQSWRSVRQGWPALLLMGVVMVAVQAGLAMSGLWNLAGFGAGLAGLAAGALVARLPRYQTASLPDRYKSPRGPTAPVARPGPGSLPCLIIVVAAAELWPWLHDVAESGQDPDPVPRGQHQPRLDDACRYGPYHQRLWARWGAAGFCLPGLLPRLPGDRPLYALVWNAASCSGRSRAPCRLPSGSPPWSAWPSSWTTAA